MPTDTRKQNKENKKNFWQGKYRRVREYRRVEKGQQILPNTRKYFLFGNGEKLKWNKEISEVTTCGQEKNLSLTFH